MLSVTLLPRCCSTGERWKDVVERTHSRLHLQTPSSRPPSLPSLQLRAHLQTFCHKEHSYHLKVYLKFSSPIKPSENKFTIKQTTTIKMSAPHLSHGIPGRGEQESKSSPRQWVSNFLLTYPVFPRSRTGCTFCTVLSTKQTPVQNIPLPPHLPQSLQGWIKHHFQLHLFVNICKYPFPMHKDKIYPPQYNSCFIKSHQ